MARRGAAAGASTGDKRQLAARRIVLLAAVAVAMVGLDVASKAWARRELRHSPLHLGVVDLVLGSNSGVAFGVGAGSSRWLVLTATAAMVVVLVIVAGWLRPTVAAGLVVGGGVANLLDRSGDGVVTDFVSVGWWPTFNLADSAICVGAVWLVLAGWWTARAGRDDQRWCRDNKGAAS